MNQRTSQLLTAVLAVVVLAVGIGASVAHRANQRDVGNGPNLVVIMTDGQFLESMRVMDRTRRALVDRGTTFSDYVVSYPEPGPSLAAYLSGRYGTNNQVLDNAGPHGPDALDPSTTVAARLHDAGYRTASIGAYLPGWGSNGELDAPEGWDRWFTLIDDGGSPYRNFSVSDDGQRLSFRGRGAAAYSTNVFARQAVAEIRDQAGKKGPFFLSFTPVAPHGDGADRATSPTAKALPDPVPAPADADAFAGAEAPRGPAYDEVDVSDKAVDVRDRPRLSPTTRRRIDAAYGAQLASLQAVDQAVEDIVQALAGTGQLDDTVIVFTSTGGAYHGEHRLPGGSYQLFEPAIHVPLVIRGPGFPAGSTADGVATNVDLAPTLLELGNVPGGKDLDGRPLTELAGRPRAGTDRGVLVQNQSGAKLHTEGIRTSRWVYLEHSDGEHELYDLAADPVQLTNRAGEFAVADQEAELARRLRGLRRCSRSACEGAPGATRGR